MAARAASDPPASAREAEVGEPVPPSPAGATPSPPAARTAQAGPPPAGRLTVRQWAALAAASGGLFALLTLDVERGGLVARLDARVSAWVLASLSEPVREAWFEIGASAPGGWPFVHVLTAVLGVLIGLRRPLWGGVYVGAVLATNAFTHALKEWTARARPDPGFTESFSFPSGHSSAATTAYLLAALLLVRVYDRPRAWANGAIAIATAVILGTGLGRVLAGVHYPGDVLGGYLLGLFVTSCILLAWKVRVTRVRREHHEHLPGQEAVGTGAT